MKIEIKKLKIGDNFKITLNDEKTYIRGEYAFDKKKYFCQLLSLNKQLELFSGTKQVYIINQKGCF